MNLWSQPTFKHRHLIQKLTQPLYADPNFGSVIVHVILKSEETAFISSLPKEDLRMEAEGYSKLMALSTYHLAKTQPIVFPENALHSKAQNEVYFRNQKTNSYFGYAISRSCQDCTVLVVYRTKAPTANLKRTYQKTIQRLNDFTVSLFNEMMGVYTEQLPNLSVSRFATDQEYRKHILRNSEPQEEYKLNDLERSILYWTSRGKTAEDLSYILELSKSTIATYRSRIISKMNVSNILEAVCSGLRYGCIV